MIRIQQLRKTFGEVVAVDGLDLEIRAGETFGLLGPNGAGKSTTILCMIGALAPDSGSIEIADLGAPTLTAARRLIGIAPQELALYLELTAEENLAFFAKLHGIVGKALAERIDWALEFAQLTDRRQSRAKEFSGGMKRRLNLACALIHEPDIVLLDEPTAGVDPQSRNHLFDNIESLKRDGKTIIYTTHYMEEAERLCDRIAIVDGGRVLALDSLDGLVGQLGGSVSVDLLLDGPPPLGVELPTAVEDGRLRFDSTEPVTDLQRLTGAGVKFAELHIQRPDLEAVFLELTGRRLRD